MPPRPPGRRCGPGSTANPWLTPVSSPFGSPGSKVSSGPARMASHIQGQCMVVIAASASAVSAG
eukprot:scaffold276210_cov25-Prasinocladus_malaysianus.AAC.1